MLRLFYFVQKQRIFKCAMRVGFGKLLYDNYEAKIGVKNLM